MTFSAKQKKQSSFNEASQTLDYYIVDKLKKYGVLLVDVKRKYKNRNQLFML